MQFVLVFIDKFIGLVKPYVHYEYFDDGVDRGYAGKFFMNWIQINEKIRKKYFDVD